MRLFWTVIGFPIGVVLVALGVANRGPITISLDPFKPDGSSLAVHPPLFIAFFVVLMIGVLIGGIAVWMSQHKHRRALHRARDEISRLKAERDQLAAERTASPGTSLPQLTNGRRAA